MFQGLQYPVQGTEENEETGTAMCAIEEYIDNTSDLLDEDKIIYKLGAIPDPNWPGKECHNYVTFVYMDDRPEIYGPTQKKHLNKMKSLHSAPP